MLIAYHGTPRSRFNVLEIGKKPTSDQLYGSGLYFTSKRSSAVSFATGKYGTIFTVDLSQLKLWDVKKDTNTSKYLAKELGIRYTQNTNMLDSSNQKKTIELLLKKGFDGIHFPFSSDIVMPNGRVLRGEDWYVVYRNADKIKILKKENKESFSKDITSNFRQKVSARYLIVATPSVWYHGRTIDSERFDLSYVGKDEAKDQEGPGFYFTTDKQDAAGYAYPSGVILTVQLKPRNLVSLTKPAPIKHVKYLINNAPNKKDTLTNWDENPNTALRMATEAMIADTAKKTFENIWYDFYRKNPKQYLETLIHLGYDGHYAEKTSKHIIIYNPEVITVIAKEKYTKGDDLP